MLGFRAVLLILVLLQRSYLTRAGTKCCGEMSVDPVITDTGFKICPSTSINSTEISSSYFLRTYEGLFFNSSDIVPRHPTMIQNEQLQYTPNGQRTNTQQGQVAGMLNGDRCCETEWKLEKHPLVTKNCEGKKICLVAFGEHRQMAYYGYCSEKTTGSCRRCAQEYTLAQVLVFRDCAFKFDFIKIPISCICLG